ncbi:histone deacetylase family protein [Kingella negevensis]|uniref:histone deacetylase family protein n=1 Tax=Kingella negevensis TaxID=1522312 RepID=UPI0009E08DA6|nr:histone deacetylase family protein [Kingella negevensis]MDK4685355.1 histone deacetylase family protein [Kingella negevensis]MDK4688903.1 histone deacetylase family protein [Kingella negevensis]MDK4708209.1 histone deacetylase family protein [Kingella negevensis]MDK4709775.1 histone deacetylase family protein [Kingella negevensis]WII92043.1 histone deacetylase family protein [Kingella negevensis]
MYKKPPLLIHLLLQQYRFVRAKILRLLDIKGRTAWIYAPECLAHFVSVEHPESPRRIEAIEQALRKSGLWHLLQKIEASEVTDIQLSRVHTRSYLSSLESQVPVSGSTKINEDTYLSRDTLNAAKHAAGAAIKAVDMVMKKQAKNAFCAIRPPGHHAASDKAAGFCFINNVSVAAMHAIAEYRLERVAIVDFDLHHGDGTEDIFRDDPRVMLLSSFEHPLYPFSGVPFSGSNPNVINSPLKAGDGSKEFRELVRAQWLPRLASFQPQMILLSAGFDAHCDDDLGHLNLTEADFEWLTKKIMLIANRHAQGRIISVLEGGYKLSSLASSAKAHIMCLVKASPFV